MRAVIDRLDSITTHEMLQAVEAEGVRFEEAFIKLFDDSIDNDSEAPKVPVFDYRPMFWDNSKNWPDSREKTA